MCPFLPFRSFCSLKYLVVVVVHFEHLSCQVQSTPHNFNSERSKFMRLKRERKRCSPTAIFHIRFFIIRHLSNTYSKLCSGIELINLKSDEIMFTDTYARSYKQNVPGSGQNQNEERNGRFALHTHTTQLQFGIQRIRVYTLRDVRMLFMLTRTTITKNCKGTHTAESTDCVRGAHNVVSDSYRDPATTTKRQPPTIANNEIGFMSLFSLDSVLVVGFRKSSSSI